MEKWLLELGNKYINRSIFILACIALFAIQGLLLFRILCSGGICGKLFDLIWAVTMSGQLLQLAQEVCLAIMFLKLMTTVYRNGYQMPLIGYLLLLSFGAGFLTFVVNNTGGQRGLLFFISSIVVSILQVIVGLQLQRTELKKLGKFIFLFPIVLLLSILLFGTFPIIVMIVNASNVVALTYAFYTVLLPCL